MRNGAWHDHEHQQVIIAQVAEEAPRHSGAARGGPRMPPGLPIRLRPTSGPRGPLGPDP
jgi:hypothetical protein